MKDEEYIEKEINVYINKYAICNHISEEEAKKHIMVKIISEYYKDGKNV